MESSDVMLGNELVEVGLSRTIPGQLVPCPLSYPAAGLARNRYIHRGPNLPLFSRRAFPGGSAPGFMNQTCGFDRSSGTTGMRSRALGANCRDTQP